MIVLTELKRIEKATTKSGKLRTICEMVNIRSAMKCMSLLFICYWRWSLSDSARGYDLDLEKQKTYTFLQITRGFFFNPLHDYICKRRCL